MSKDRLTKLKHFLCNAEINSAELAAEGEGKIRFMNGPKRMLNILTNKEGE